MRRIPDVEKALEELVVRLYLGNRFADVSGVLFPESSSESLVTGLSRLLSRHRLRSLGHLSISQKARRPWGRLKLSPFKFQKFTSGLPADCPH